MESKAVVSDIEVLDFGVARADFEDRESQTKSRFFGSANYMAPERFDAIVSLAFSVTDLARSSVAFIVDSASDWKPWAFDVCSLKWFAALDIWTIG